MSNDEEMMRLVGFDVTRTAEAMLQALIPKGERWTIRLVMLSISRNDGCAGRIRKVGDGGLCTCKLGENETFGRNARHTGEVDEEARP